MVVSDNKKYSSSIHQEALITLDGRSSKKSRINNYTITSSFYKILKLKNQNERAIK